VSKKILNLREKEEVEGRKEKATTSLLQGVDIGGMRGKLGCMLKPRAGFS